jgi:hypothetical protein
MSSSWFSRLQKRFAKRPRLATRRRSRLELEALEERMLLATRFVVPTGAADNVTTFDTLLGALATPGLNAGDVIQIEPNSTPKLLTNALLPAVKNLTIQGDPAFNVQSIPYFYVLDNVIIGSAQQGFTLKNVQVDIQAGPLQFNANGTITGCRIKNDFAGGTAIFLNGTNQAVISNSYIENTNPLNQYHALMGLQAGNFSNNSITGNQVVDTTGLNNSLLDYIGGTGTNDLIAHNTFIGNSGNPLLEVAGNAQGLTIQANTITDGYSGGHAMTVGAGAQNLQILDNVITFPNGGDTGIWILSNGQTASTNLVIANNRISTGGKGTGLTLVGEEPAYSFVATVQGNDLRGNLYGVYFASGSGGSFAGIDLGSGAQGSAGGNDFRGDTWALYVGVNVSAAAGPIQAQMNLFGDLAPILHIYDQHNDPTLALVNAANPQLERNDILGQEGNQWWRGVSSGAAFATSMFDNWDPNVTWVDVVTGDFNGDGKTDIAARNAKTGQWWVEVSNGQFYTASVWTTWNPALTWVDVKVGDFDGFGRDSIIGRAQQTGQWWLAESNGASFNNSLWGVWNPNVTWVDVNVGNFTGHRYADIAGRMLETGQWWVAASSDAGFTNSLWTTWNTAITWADVRVGDFNGDGLDDIAGRYLQTGQWWVAQSTGTSFTNSPWTTWNTALTWVDVKVGDFNGDGKMDIVGRAKETGQWWVAQSNGSTFTNSPWAIWNTAVTWVDVQVGDFNGDGLSDITGRQLQYGQWWSETSNGKTFDTALWTTWNPALTWVNVRVGDFA